MAEYNDQEVASEEAAQALMEQAFGGGPLWEAIPLQPAFPVWLPPASGLYTWEWSWKVLPLKRVPKLPVIPARTPIPQPDPVGPIPMPTAPSTSAAREELTPVFPWWWRREELRLDVDGRYPQLTASGTLYSGLSVTVHWIAELTKAGFNTWTGPIWYKDGSTASLPYTNVTVSAVRSWFPNNRKATVTFSGGGLVDRVRTFTFKSRYFHEVEFEYDSVSNANPISQIATCDHPNRPASMACETLTVNTVYQRAGFDVRNSGGNGSVPLSDAGGNATWSDMEMHDAMQTFWSRFSNAAQWSMWVFWAALHDRGNSLGGIMFDDIGPNHRQGTAIFTEAFIKNPPASEPASDQQAWVNRMQFWTVIHEMGHGFNLAHSWQKELGTSWIPLINDSEARSFMNYPFFVNGKQAAFFADFENRFIDEELLFMRHAPSRFVQMGNADWFDHHGFEEALVNQHPSLRLEVRPNRDKSLFEFLEPVVLEVKLTNIGTSPLILGDDILQEQNLTVIISKRGGAARQWIPYAQYCVDKQPVTIDPGVSRYETVPVFAGLNGWDLSEPGVYLMQVAATIDQEYVVSNQTALRIAAPRSFAEEDVATDFFSEEVGRALTFGGTKTMSSANRALENVLQEVPKSRAAKHAEFALANPLTRAYRSLELPQGTAALTTAIADNGAVTKSRPNYQKAADGLGSALIDTSNVAAETFGHIEYKKRVDDLSAMLDKAGDTQSAADAKDELYEVLTKRKVLPSVLEEIDDERKKLRSKAGKVSKSTASKKKKSAKK